MTTPLCGAWLEHIISPCAFAHGYQCIGTTCLYRLSPQGKKCA